MFRQIYKVLIRRDDELRLIRENRSAWMIYPEDRFKELWDSLMAFVLIVTCFVTPIRIAFYTKDDLIWVMINYTIDMLFLTDIVVIFNTAFYDDDFQMIENRKDIACFYLKGWFIIDVLSIFPLAEIANAMNPADQQSPEEFN